jgi:hypothetical protein
MFVGPGHSGPHGRATLALTEGPPCPHDVTTVSPNVTASVMSGKQFILTSP